MNCEEGSICPACGDYYLEYIPDGDCSCHINPPCSACTGAKLTCPGCGEVYEEEEEVKDE